MYDDPQDNGQNGVTQDDQTPVTNPTPMGGDNTPVSPIPGPVGEVTGEDLPSAPAEDPTPMGDGEPSAPVETLPTENPA